MKAPLAWLNELLDRPVGLAEAADAFLRIGFEVEEAGRFAPGLDTVVVGQIVGIAPHPDADKLRVCQTDLGLGAPVQIVTGAANVKLHDKIPVAKVGSKLPGGKEILASKLRGVESFGMYCSLVELGLPPGEDGVFVLPADAKVGTPIADQMGLGEELLDLAITANRPDALGLEGLARELALATGRQLKLVTPEPVASDAAGEGRVLLGEIDLGRCPRYLGLNLSGVKVGPSPDWVKARLEQMGQRSINNVVDATNLVMLQTGQPLHAFDADTLRGGKIQVRLAKAGESLAMLDGVTRALAPEDLVVADAERALVVAGVMGGVESGVSEATTELFLEAAAFEPSGVRRTRNRLGLATESSARFERGVDAGGTWRALLLLRDLILKLAGGAVVGAVRRAEAEGMDASTPIDFHLDGITRLTGLEIVDKEVERILVALGFEMARHTDGVFELNSYEVTVPSWRRRDVTMEADLVEEVVRHWGYEHIQAVLPPAIARPEQPLAVVLERQARQAAIGLGLQEVMTKSLTTREAEALAGFEGPHVALSNPTKDMAVLRTSLVPGLLEVLRHNRNQGLQAMGAFEVGRSYHPKGQGEQPSERRWLALAVVGSSWKGLWHPDHAPEALQADALLAKGMAEQLLEALGRQGEAEVEAASDLKGMHPGRSALLKVGHEVVGGFGELHPAVAEAFDLGQGRVAIAWLDLDAVAALPAKDGRFVAFGRSPAVLRDLAFVVPEGVGVQDLHRALAACGDGLLEKVSVFDRYTGPQLGEGKVSYAFGLSFRAERNLTSEEVDGLVQGMATKLNQSFGAVVRGA